MNTGYLKIGLVLFGLAAVGGVATYAVKSQHHKISATEFNVPAPTMPKPQNY